MARRVRQQFFPTWAHPALDSIPTTPGGAAVASGSLLSVPDILIRPVEPTDFGGLSLLRGPCERVAASSLPGGRQTLKRTNVAVRDDRHAADIVTLSLNPTV